MKSLPKDYPELLSYITDTLKSKITRLNILPDYHTSILCLDITNIIADELGGNMFYANQENGISETYAREKDRLTVAINEYLSLLNFSEEVKKSIVEAVFSMFYIEMAKCTLYIPNGKTARQRKFTNLILNDCKFMTVKEVARKYNRSVQWIYKLIKEHKGAKNENGNISNI